MKNIFGKTLRDVLFPIFYIHIMNGPCGSDLQTGDATFIGNNGASVVDFICTLILVFTRFFVTTFTRIITSSSHT